VNILFAGTPAFAAAALDALLQAGHQVPLVLTQPDRPAGRGLKPQASAVKQLALSKGLAVAQPLTLKDDAVIAQLAAVNADVMVVAAYGLILPQPVLDLPRLGCLNIHASLLPRWRGAAPIQRAILADDRETGVTIMQMDAGLDTGAMLLKQAIPIAGDDNAQTLHDKLAALGAQLIVQALHEKPVAVAQDPAQASYAAKITKTEARIDWARPAAELARAIRAYNPMPGAYTCWQGQPLKLWRAEAVTAAPGVPGTVLQADAQGIVVAAGEGALRLHELQRAGSKRLAAQAFLAGANLHPGDRLDV
jgi:methionyl-tRNA formyltransferase